MTLEVGTFRVGYNLDDFIASSGEHGNYGKGPVFPSRPQNHWLLLQHHIFRNGIGS